MIENENLREDLFKSKRNTSNSL